MQSAQEIVYPIQLPDWQIVQVERYESDEILLAFAAEVLEGGTGVPQGTLRASGRAKDLILFVN